MMRIIFSIVFVLTTTVVSAQTEANLVKENQALELDGLYTFAVEGVDHQVNILSQELTFKEYDNTGTLLGEGTFYLEDDMYVFVPTTLSAQSMINNVITAKILDRNGADRRVDVRYQNERAGRLINLQKQ